MTTETPVKKPIWTPTKVQSLYRHQNGRQYARTFAGGKEKWTSLRTTLLPCLPHLHRAHAGERSSDCPVITDVKSRKFGAKNF